MVERGINDGGRLWIRSQRVAGVSRLEVAQDDGRRLERKER
jgi:hypothetical protein